MSLRTGFVLLVLAAAVNGCARSGPRAAHDFASRGDRYLAAGRNSAAAIEYRSAIKADPTWAPGHAGLARAYEAMGKPDDAYREYSNAINLDANDVQSRLGAGRLLFDAHMYQETQIRAEQVIDRDPHNSDALVLLARAYAAAALETGDTAGAEAVLRGAVGQVPAAVEAHVALAEFLTTDRRPAEAERELVATVRQHPGDELANRALASFYQTTGRADAAERYLEAAAAVPQQRYESALALDAQMLLRDKKIDEASRSARAALDLDPHLAAANYVAGVIDLGRRQLTDAEREFREAARSQRLTAAANLQLARTLLAAGHADDAVQLAAAAGTAYDARLTLARALLATGDTERARAELVGLQGVNPSDAEAAILLARVELEAGDVAAAREHAARATAAAPNDPAALLIAGEAALAAHDSAAAEPLLTRAVTAQPSFDGATMLAQLYVARGELDRAEKLFVSLARRYPDAAGPHTAVGIVLEAAGRSAEARKAYEEAVALDPNDPVAAYNLARMYTADPAKVDSAVALAQTAAVGAPGHPEVHDTLGWAYFKTGRLRSAADELERAVSLRPQDAGYRQHLTEVRKAIETEKAEAAVKRTAM
jgi:tetratricopeptide (TPR) repeat protein